MKIAFKEWAIVVDALARGEQIIILRKGGIAEGPGGFQPEYPEFWLFPTQFHQQRESVIEPAQKRCDELAPSSPGADRVRVEYHARVVDWRRLSSIAEAGKLNGQHIWRDEVIMRRFDWGRVKNIHALAVRISRLATPIELPMTDAYAGCKSWVELDRELDGQSLTPVLSDADFTRKLQAFHQALA